MTDEDIETRPRAFRLRTLPVATCQVELVSGCRKESKSGSVTSRREFHQVKRMVVACGKEVVDLQRLTMELFNLGCNLKPGEWRRLSKEELESFKLESKQIVIAAP